jgi:chaperonin GroES
LFSAFNFRAQEGVMMIDLRSDTVTRPTAEMLDAMQHATLGDDSRDGDATVQRLEALAAERTGKEAGMYVPSGTMSNLVALLAHADRGAYPVARARLGEHVRRPFIRRDADLALLLGECQQRLPIPSASGYSAKQRWHSHGASAKAGTRSLSTGGCINMKLKPLGDRLIVRAVEEEETTASGLVLPDTAKEKPQKGKVIAVGDGKWDEDGEKRVPLDVSKGDEVLYSKYGGTEITIDGEDLLVLRECDVLAIVTSERTQENELTWHTRSSSTTRRRARPSRPASTQSPTPSR